ncbi:MAG: TonB-dependent receptor, partial [Chitinophagaceae bacterium]
DANKAINNTRQILGRIPGLNIVETETGGFTADGIATRGLNPVQSIEMNTRQNGYNISADIYGYNESYYVPPMEAVQRIEMVRGAASLQFGAQFGGLVNYVIQDAPVDKVFEFKTSQTIGSFGLFNSFNSIGGTYKKFSYYGYVQYRNLEGYRPNSQQWQLSGFGKVQYNASKKLNVGIEYSFLRNQIQMPGGLTDSMFNENPRISTRARNWLKTPWNIIAAHLDYNPSENSTLSLKTTYLFCHRSLVWRNEDGGAGALDNIDPATNAFEPREVGIKDISNVTTELRYTHSYRLLNMKSTLAGGVRVAYAWYKKLGGDGTTGSDFDLTFVGDLASDLDFTTTNIAPFVENIFRLGNKFSITPGFRFEYLDSKESGYKVKSGEKLMANEDRSRTFPLFGIGLEYKATNNTNIYGNISQAYSPITYSELEPLGVTSKIDPNLKDSYGFNSDLGYRGTIKNFLNFDIGLFYLAYNNRIGVVVLTDQTTGNQYSYRTNIANSVHKGIESYIEFNLLKYLNAKSKTGLSVFNSFAYIDARYTSGVYKGNRVETAAKTINRVGLIFNTKSFSATFQVNSVGDAYGDASNVKLSTDPIAGYIPAYTVLDLSATYKINNYAVKFGVNNLTNKSYFTRRADEYPGPGIIPSIGRSFYVGFSAKF